MKRKQPHVWVVEARGVSGRWMPLTGFYFLRKWEAIAELKNQKSEPCGYKFRIAKYVRQP